ncbi:MAG: histidine kinase, partial [bacterium]|nr:histidine kinase [bacterium]
GNPGGISDNFVRTIYQDREGTLWVGTNKGGLNRFKPKAGSFKHYLHNPENSNSICNNRVWDICEDRKGNLLIGTEKGLSLFNPREEHFVLFKNRPGNPTSLDNNKVRVLHVTPGGVIWVGTQTGVNRYNDREKNFTRYPLSNEKNGPAVIISALFSDRPGKLWIGTVFNGLIILNPGNGEIKRHNVSQGTYGISSNNIRCITKDHSGTLWIGTRGDGVNKVNLLARKNTYLTVGTSAHNGIAGIEEDRDGHLWIGTSEDGIVSYDPAKRKLSRYRHIPGNSDSLSKNNIRSLYIHPGKKETLWIGTDGGGLNKLSLANKERFKRFKHNPANPDSLINNSVYSISGDNSGSLWLGTYGGLDKFDPREETFTHFKHSSINASGLSDNLVYATCTDREGLLWIGTRDGGLNRWDKKNGRFVYYQHRHNEPESLGNNRINAIYEDPDQNKRILWLATHGGLDKFDLEKSTFTHYKEIHGLSDDIVYGILPDATGSLWLSTYKGLSRFNPRTGTFKNYDASDGFLNSEFNQNAFCKSKTGKFYFGGSRGIDIFAPENIKENPFLPKTVIADIRILGKRVDNRRLTKKNTRHTVLALSYKEYSFTIQFAALHYAAPHKNKYTYILEGFEENWSYTDARKPFSTYTNLNPGKYLFKVKSSNSDGVWDEKGKAIEIIIKPPLWATWWFRCIVLFLFVMVIYGLHRIRTRALKKQKEKLRALVTSRTAQLESKTTELQLALDKVKTLKGLLPICAGCKKIRGDTGYWEQIEVYIEKHSDADFSHSLCPDCAQELYPGMFDKKSGEKKESKE